MSLFPMYSPTVVVAPDATVTYLGEASTSSNSATWTLSAHTLSTPAANRRIVVCCADQSVSQRNVSSMTIGGVSASLVLQPVLGASWSVCMWIADVPIGATGDIVINWSGAVGTRNGMCAYALYTNATGATNTASDGTSGSNSANITCPAGGVIIGYMAGSGPTAMAWTNLTEDFDTVVVAFDYLHGGASDAFATLQTSRTISITYTGPIHGLAGGLILASFAKD